MHLILIIAFSLALIVSARSRGLSPISFLLFYYLVSFLTFTFVYDQELTKRDLYVFFYIQEFPNTSYTATPLYEASISPEHAQWLSAIVLFTLTFSFLISKLNNAKSHIKNTLNGGFSIAIPSIILVGAALTFSFIALYLSLSIDYASMQLSTSYQEIKNPQNIGLDDPMGRIFLFFIKIFGPILLFFAAYSFERKKIVCFLLFLFPAVFSFHFNAITSSRYIIVFAVGLLAISFSKRSYLRMFLYFTCIIALFNFAIISRSKGIYGIDAIDFDLLYATVVTLDHALMGLVLNVFDNILVFAQASAMDVFYPASYKLSSLSPLPSFLDGFNVRDEVRISEVVPFNGVSELFHFGLQYQFLATVVLVLFVSQSERLYGELNDATLRLGLLAWVALLNQLFAQYQLRGSFRFIVFSLLAIYVIRIQLSRRRRKIEVKYL